MKECTILFFVLLSILTFTYIDKQNRNGFLETKEVDSSYKLIIKAKKRLSGAEVKKIEKSIEGLNLKLFIPEEKDKTSYFYTLYSADIDQRNEQIMRSKLLAINTIESVETNGEIDVYYVLPPDNLPPTTKDPLARYQWYLENLGHKLERKVTLSVKLPPLVGDEEWDLELDKFYAENESKVNRDVVVAVIDSGLSFTHQDLDDIVYKNEVDCINGRRPTPRRAEDNDGNGYKGDCTGWNFVNPRMSNYPQDLDGHGTFISGILSAKNNEKGIKGLSSKIKVLPIKVFQKFDKSGDGAKGKKIGRITDRVAKAIRYAITRKVDVINLSLGWPRIFDATFLRKAFEEAKAAGIPIVAASGNNGHSGLIYPCAYEGVLCVGASSVDGSLAKFSNFGGSVDVLAPGDGIVSTVPESDSIARLFFDEPYDIKLGTSFSAPMVSGLIALLKGAEDSFKETPLSIDETHQLVLLGTKRKKNEGDMFSQKGNISYDKSFDRKLLERPFARPLFKEERDAIYYANQNLVEFKVKVKAYASDVANLKVQFKHKHPGLSLHNDSIIIDFLKAGETKELTFKGGLADDSVDQKLSYTITLNYNNYVESYKDKTSIISDNDSANNLIKVAIPNTDNSLKIVQKDPRTGLSRTRLFSILRPQGSSGENYYYVPEKTETNLFVYMFKVNKDLEWVELGKLDLGLEFSVQSIYMLDIDQNGKEDFVIRTEHQKADETTGAGAELAFSFFNEDLSKVFKMNRWIMDSNLTGKNTINLRNLRLLSHDHPELGKVNLLSQFEFGIIENDSYQNSELNQSRALADREQNVHPVSLMRARIKPDYNYYVYYPRKINEEEARLEIKVFNNYKLKEVMKKVLTLYRTSINFHYAHVQNFYEGAKQEVVLVGSLGNSTNRKYFELKVPNDLVINKENIKNNIKLYTKKTYYPLHKMLRGRFWNLAKNDKGIEEAHALYRTQGNYKLEWTDALSRPAFPNLLEIPLGSDGIANFDVTFKLADGLATVVKGQGRYHVQWKGEENITYSEELQRYTYLPEHYFSELIRPLAFGTKGQYRPAIFVNTSAISENRISVIEVTKGGMIAPVKYSIKLEAHCRLANPERFGTSSTYHIPFLCQKEDQSYEFRLLPLE